jgi:4-amino-4-deoxy-L-arabinose transferase-like glycosyltransferase
VIVLSTSPSSPTVSRAEWAWLVAAVLCGAVLRLGTLHRVAVEHFDEAVYAANMLIEPELGGEFPRRQFYAPPLLPAAIEWTTILGQLAFGATPRWWPMVPSLLAGLATIPSVWWIVRQWLSPRAGLMAAYLIAFQEFHAAYSRTALTDVPLALFLLWAVHWFWRALRNGSNTDAVIAGIFTALAWWTKYNGWLPLAIAAAGGVCWQLLTPRGERNWVRVIRVCGVGSVTAFVLWLPVLWDCQKVGGYAQVMENHRGYFTGFARWIPHLVQGYENLDQFLGPLSFAGVLAALLIRFAPQACLPTPSAESNSNSRLLAQCLYGAWFWGLLVATPMYAPYSRLWVPWIVAASILIADLLSTASFSIGRTLAAWYQSSLHLAGGLCLVLWMACAFSGSPQATPSCFEARDGFWEIAESLHSSARNDETVFVVGESDPPLWYGLRRQGALAALSRSLDLGRNSDWRLVLGPMSQRMADLQAELERQQIRLELAAEYPAALSRIALLDLVAPRELAARPESRQLVVRVYRLRK